MSKPKESVEYDAIIIGAGIGGLVCGCYLAKAGLKVLIVEQHNKPGGYCTSFKRKGFTFDAAAHCFGSFRKDGIMDWVVNDLELRSILKIKKYNPSDIIISPEGDKIVFYSDLHRTVATTASISPNDSKNIKTLFDQLKKNDPVFFSGLRNSTFEDILKKYINNKKLTKILAFPFLGLGGIPASQMSAFVGSKLFSEFLLDGGYYPLGGMQELPNALVQRLKDLKGKIIYRKAVKRIKTIGNKVNGVIFNDNTHIISKYVISNCDARQTFLKLLGNKKIEESFREKIKNMIPSISNFILYLGLKEPLDSDFLSPGTSIWFMKTYDYEKIYYDIINNKIGEFVGCMIRLLPNKKTILATIPAPFKTKSFWIKNKKIITDTFLDNIEKNVFHDIKRYISHIESATPQTLYRYTLNYKGASFGWAGTPDQFGIYKLRKPSFIKNLYLVGHWTTLGVGISGVAYVGYDTANLILKREKLYNE